VSSDITPEILAEELDAIVLALSVVLKSSFFCPCICGFRRFRSGYKLNTPIINNPIKNKERVIKVL
jgi:hypothetical protein